MEELTKNEYKICVCSNSIRKTILITLSRLNIIKYIDLIVSNEDVKNSKPYPDIYWKAITKMGFLPEETLIVEDSPYGLLAAHRSKSHVFRVKNSTELSIKNIIKKISQINNEEKKPPKWEDEKLTILIPMAGEGSRFKQEGYILPKPLIDVNGKPMIQVVINNLNINANYIYIVQKQHREKYNLDTLLNIITPECKIVEVDGLTEGAACTALLAKDFINNNNPLFLANSDQFVEWDSNGFMYKMNETNSDAGIVTFKSTEPKWSFVKVNEEGMVNEVAEKDPISDIATVGFYYWKHGSDFVKYTEEMIKNNIRVNNEFYICPVFNEAIKDNKKIRIFDVSKMWGLGTPKDLDHYLENHKKIKKL
jgi:dTDP-glucose pyrophosphorylase